MSLANLIRQMSDAGAPAEAIALAVEAIEAADAKLVAQREAARDRKRKQRASQDGHVTVTGQSEDSHAHSPAPPSSLPPRPPILTTPTPPDTTTRAKDVRIAKPNGFAKWWEAYPNKVAKPAAEKAYAKACVSIGGPDPPAVLLDGLERAKRSRQWLEGFIPHPTTWLNQGRWGDEPSETPPRQALKAFDGHARPQPSDAKRAAREANYARAFAAPVMAADGSWD